MSNIILSAQSNSNEIKAYFNTVLNLTKSGESFPIDLDDVWPLCYVQKVKAVQFLTDSGQFYEGEDYVLLTKMVKNESETDEKLGVIFSQKVKNSSAGRPTNKYMLSVPCMEYLIARKVRSVFEVYRRVFHEFLNTRRMSDDEVILRAMMILQGRVQMKGKLLANQSKKIALLRNRVEEKKQSEKPAAESVDGWLAENGYSGEVKLSELYSDYVSFCGRNGLTPLYYKSFSKALRGKGIIRIHKRTGSWYKLS